MPLGQNKGAALQKVLGWLGKRCERLPAVKCEDTWTRKERPRAFWCVGGPLNSETYMTAGLPAESMMALGDGSNDLEMLQLAGTSVRPPHRFAH